MSTNDDTTVKDLAKKLSEAAEISISIPGESESGKIIN